MLLLLTASGYQLTNLPVFFTLFAGHQEYVGFVSVSFFKFLQIHPILWELLTALQVLALFRSLKDWNSFLEISVSFDNPAEGESNVTFVLTCLDYISVWQVLMAIAAASYSLQAVDSVSLIDIAWPKGDEHENIQ